MRLGKHQIWNTEMRARATNDYNHTEASATAKIGCDDRQLDVIDDVHSASIDGVHCASKREKVRGRSGSSS